MPIDKEERNKIKSALAKVTSMNVEDFQNELEKQGLEFRTLDNYIFDLAQAIKESKKEGK